VGDVLVQKTFVSPKKMALLRQRRYRDLAYLIASERGLGKLRKGLRHLLGKSWFAEGDFTRRWDALIDTVAEELRRDEGHPCQLKLFYMRHRERRAIAGYSTELLARFTRAVYPFLENDFFELVMSIPEELKAELPLEEDMVGRAAPELRTIPSASALRAGSA